MGAVVAGIVLAAGQGRRFEGLKQLAMFRGRPLLEHPVAAMMEALGGDIFVVLGHEAGRIAREADLGAATVVECLDWDRGQSASLRRGVEAARGALPNLDAVVITLGDQPLIRAAAIRRVVSARRGGAAVVRATYGGRPGHPVLLAGQALARVGGVEGDVGARELIEELGFDAVACDDVGSDVDIDTTEDLIELEKIASRRRSGPLE